MIGANPIRLATCEDGRDIREIYAPHVLDHHASFEQEVPSVQEMERRITNTLSLQYPWLVCQNNASELMGYAYAGKFRERRAYRWSVEVTVYIAERFQRQGVGRALYTSLFNILKKQEYCNAFASISLPNEASVRLHESIGFHAVGILENAGYKLGKWRDVGMWQMQLLPPNSAPPNDPLGYGLIGNSELEDCIRSGLPCLHFNQKDQSQCTST